MRQTLTDPQQKLLTFVFDHIRTKGHPPTFREICHAFGYRSTGTARDHVRALVNKGYLRPPNRKSRGLLPTGGLRGVRGLLSSLPILGRVAAGGPVLAEENVEGMLDLSREFSGDKVFALKVRGDSMEGAGICDGDLVVVRSQERAEPHEIVVAMVDGEATVKKLARRGSRLWLQPANPRYDPIPFEGDAHVIGKVIGVIRSYERKF